jgi:hypothetical protein
MQVKRDGLQKPTVKPRYVVSESPATGLPECGQYLLIATATCEFMAQGRVRISIPRLWRHR